MKKLLFTSLYIILLLSLNVTAYAQKVVTMNFNLTDYQFITNNGLMHINTSKAERRKAGDFTCPHLPYFPCRIIIPENLDTIPPYTLTYTTQQLYNNISMAANPIAVPTDNPTPYQNVAATTSVTVPVYNEGIINHGGCKYLFLKVSPFTYNVATGTLNYTSSVQISLPTLGGTPSNVIPAEVSVNEEDIAYQMINPEDFEIYYTERDFFEPEFRCNYLIITNNALASSFEPLRRWKSQKGLYASIVTIEDIENDYYGDDIQMQIKNCIDYHYTYGSTKYVLLGGDETVVPVQQCPIGYYENEGGPGAAPSLLLTSTPTDLFYACLNGPFDWNLNGNTTKGEPSDSINMNPQVYLTRIPVNTTEEVQAFTNKLLAYERGTGTYNSLALSRLLFTGSKLYEPQTGSGPTDAYCQSKMTADYFVSPTNWNGSIYYFTDYSVVLPENGNNVFSATNLSTEINRGYGLMVETSHGSPSQWNFGNYGYYTDIQAAAQTNAPASVILTAACLTNQFDGQTPSLCEAFLNNANGGAVSYFGSSREGWLDSDILNTIGFSTLYNALFLQNLLTSLPTNSPYSYGAVAAKTKQDLIEECSNYNLYRWLQFSINPMGDPEMPIFTDVPNVFNAEDGNGSTPIIFNQIRANQVQINTGVPNCKVVMSSNGQTLQVVDSVQYHTFQMSCDTCTFTVLKHNYYPYSETFIRESFLDEPILSILIEPTGLHSIDVSLLKKANTNDRTATLPRSGLWTIDVSDVTTGRNVFHEIVTTSQREIDTTNWKSGIYIIQATADEQTKTEKIYIQ